MHFWEHPTELGPSGPQLLHTGPQASRAAFIPSLWGWFTIFCDVPDPQGLRTYVYLAGLLLAFLAGFCADTFCARGLPY